MCVLALQIKKKSAKETGWGEFDLHTSPLVVGKAEIGGHTK